MKSLIAVIVVLASLAVDTRGQMPGSNAAVKTTTVPLDRLNEQQARNVKTEWVTYKGRKALRVTDADGKEHGRTRIRRCGLPRQS
jgi:hypothetical protein